MSRINESCHVWISYVMQAHTHTHTRVSHTHVHTLTHMRTYVIHSYVTWLNRIWHVFNIWHVFSLSHVTYEWITYVGMCVCVVFDMYFQAYVSKFNAPRAAYISSCTGGPPARRAEKKTLNCWKVTSSDLIRRGGGGCSLFSKFWQKYVPGPGLPKKTY